MSTHRLWQKASGGRIASRQREHRSLSALAFAIVCVAIATVVRLGLGFISTLNVPREDNPRVVARYGAKGYIPARCRFSILPN
jgi:hypothetical protein